MDERAKLLKIAKSVNMNTQEITLNIVENLSKTRHDEFDRIATTAMTTPASAVNRHNKSEFLSLHGSAGQVLNDVSSNFYLLTLLLLSIDFTTLSFLIE